MKRRASHTGGDGERDKEHVDDEQQPLGRLDSPERCGTNEHPGQRRKPFDALPSGVEDEPVSCSEVLCVSKENVRVVDACCWRLQTERHRGRCEAYERKNYEQERRAGQGIQNHWPLG